MVMTLEICGRDHPVFPQNEIPAGQDALPEFCHYRDEGCELADSCLRCPFTKCEQEEGGGRQRGRKKARDQEVVRLAGEGKSTRELAQIFGVSTRTIQRTLMANSRAG
jgi:hypothetical protein